MPTEPKGAVNRALNSRPLRSSSTVREDVPLFSITGTQGTPELAEEHVLSGAALETVLDHHRQERQAIREVRCSPIFPPACLSAPRSPATSLLETLDNLGAV